MFGDSSGDITKQGGYCWASKVTGKTREQLGEPRESWELRRETEWGGIKVNHFAV